MASRTRRTWAELRAIIRVLLRDLTAGGRPGYFEDSDLLTYMLLERDRLEMLLGETHEGVNVVRYKTNRVANLAFYPVPNVSNRVRRVLLRDTNGNEVPLERLERHTEGTVGNSSSNLVYTPTYRLLNDSVVIDPAPPETVTNGLVIEVETARDLVTQDSDTVIPTDWPMFCETWLAYATALRAFDSEGAQGPEPEGLYRSYVDALNQFEVQLREFVQTRSFGRTFSTGLYLGD